MADSQRADLRLKPYLLQLVLWIALIGFLHFAFFPSYANVLLIATEWVVGWLTQVKIQLGLAPTNVGGLTGSKGFLMLVPGLAQPFYYPHNVYSVTLNFMFAPALVLATLGTSGSAWLKAGLSALLLLGFHVVHLTTIALYFPLTQVPIPNPLIDEAFPTWLGAAIQWNYGFTDKMGYTLFPFIAWLAVCYSPLVELIESLTGQRNRG